LSEIRRYSSTVRDILTFKGYFWCTLHANSVHIAFSLETSP
jgi:hypothetical protein